LVAGGALAQGYRYEVTNLTKQYALAASADLIDMNDSGAIVGAQDGYGFVIQNGKLTQLERPKGSQDYYAFAINGGGVILGTARYGFGQPQKSVIWVNGKATLPDVSPALGFQSKGPLNALNNIGGFAGTDHGIGRPIKWTEQKGVEYLPTPGGSGGASGINDSETVVGSVLTGGIIRATRWVDGVYQDLHPAGYSESSGWGIAQNGDIGGDVEMPGFFHAAFWRNGTEFIDIGALSPVDYTFFGDLNSHEQMVGQATFKNEFAAYLWERNTLYNLDDLVDPALKIRFRYAGVINESGLIIASGSIGATGGGRLLLTPVPEPAPAISLLTFLSSWFFIRQRRLKNT
jgi:hypothetical protein